MKKVGLIFLLCCGYTTVIAQQAYWQQQVDFTIKITLNDTEHTLTGVEQINYKNNSPDTLYFIWFHLWANAYKNDRSAFSDQLLANGNTDFYFAVDNKKGYTNRLNFIVNNETAFTEDHPVHQDIVKLILPKPLPPAQSTAITTSFHVKLPYNFSRGGHVAQQYQITQWYPKPAVYDKYGWHPMPYLDQGEFYNNFGNYDVQITLPSNYVVAATGKLQSTVEKEWLLQANSVVPAPNTTVQKGTSAENKKNKSIVVQSSNASKTIQYLQKNVHDFAWFASKSYKVLYDTLQLPNGQIIEAYAYVLPHNIELWKNSLAYIKKAVLSKSNWIGNYPYQTITVVDNPSAVEGGMEYPSITILTANDEQSLEELINHEVGHNWFQASLANNEREYPWMDEGMNSYYDVKYRNEILNIAPHKANTYWQNKFNTTELDKQILQTIINLKKDQPINTVSDSYNNINYNFIAYTKAALWLQALEQQIGAANFTKGMQTYYSLWQGKHPTPLNFKDVMENIAGTDLTNIFNLLGKKGNITKPKTKQIRLTTLFNLSKTDQYHYLAIAPAIGYNAYDKLMLGAVVHNYNLPISKFQFVAAPLFAFGTKQINGIANAAYHWLPGNNNSKLTLSVGIGKFTGNAYTDSTGFKNALGFSKIAPCIQYQFTNKNPRSRIKKTIQFKSFFINETKILFAKDAITNADIITYPTEGRYLNQLQAVIENDRILYPYFGRLQAEQGQGFARLNFTGQYYFNYAKNGGLQVRAFAGKFIYTGDKSITTKFKTDQFHLNLTGAKGNEDYTYNDYFVGRNKFEGLGSQQIANRDGFFKVRSDLLSNKIGRTDNWLAAVNFVTDIPESVNLLNVLPVKIPLKIFVDVGTYAEAWSVGSNTGKLLYDAGFQLSVLHNTVIIYVPLVYSKVYADYFKSTITEKRFLKNISFCIDVHQLKIKNFLPQLNF